MELTRKTTLKIHYFLDQIIPPFLRDSKWLMKILFKLFYKKQAYSIFLEFKNKAIKMTEKEFCNIYKEISSYIIQRETDTTDNCMDEILKNIIGRTVLEVGCGECVLGRRMSRKFLVTATDIALNPQLVTKNRTMNLLESSIERLPFKDKAFDTVVCTHTLEHTRNIFQSIEELRRVAKKKLIVVVPKQRPYKYTFDLHLHFFPYIHSLLGIMGTSENRTSFCEEIDGDLLYIENNK